MEYNVISADDHVSETPGVWVDRVPAKIKQHVPHIQEIEGISTWFIGNEPVFRAGYAKNQEEIELRNKSAVPGNGTRSGDWNPIERLKDYTKDGVDAAALFPNFARFTGDPLGIIKDRDIRLACIQAYNDWLAEEFCKPDPQRLIPLALIPPWDVELAKAEAERSARKGHRGAIFGAALDVFGYTPTWDKYWDPLYSTLEDLNIPLIFHQPSASLDRPIFLDPNVNLPQYIRTSARIAHTHSLIYPTCELLMSGILEHHPRLKVLLAESGASWLLYTLSQSDYNYKLFSPYDGNELTMLPSDYFRRQCHAGFWSDVITPELVKWVGEDNILWEGDYLHTIATFPQSQEIIDISLKAVEDPTIRHKLLAGNSIKLFGL